MSSQLLLQPPPLLPCLYAAVLPTMADYRAPGTISQTDSCCYKLPWFYRGSREGTDVYSCYNRKVKEVGRGRMGRKKRRISRWK